MSNCYTCKYKSNIPSDAHISCQYPLLSNQDRTTITVLSLSNISDYNKVLKDCFGFEAILHGIQNGYFMFPENFDPVWMSGTCNKHSDLVGEAVEYQLELNRLIEPYKALYISVKKENKSIDEYKYILDAYESSITKSKNYANKTEEEKSIGRSKLISDLNDAFLLLESHEKKKF